MTYAKQLIHGAHGGAGAGSGRGFDAILREFMGKRKPVRVCQVVADSVSRVSCLGLLAASAMVALGTPPMDLLFIGGRFSAADAKQCARLLCGVFVFAVFVVGAGYLFACILCRGKYLCADGGGDGDYGDFAANLRGSFTDWGNGTGCSHRILGLRCRR